MSDDVERFDRWSKTYESCWGQRFFDRVHELMLDLVIAAAPAFTPPAILDVGCGTGRLLRKAAAHWPAARLIGVDPAQGMVDVAHGLTSAVRFCRALAVSLPLDNASVDLMTNSISIHHWRNASLGALEVARVVRPGGLFCLADISIPWWFSKLVRSKAKSRKEARKLLLGSGFEIQRQETTLARFVHVSVARKPGQD
ncbi:MAG: class I SAM-dependent methyltransferase [Terriglobia bacterium]|jgi:ubiquinone/menaquinone biosynthesis C-methylase UbiE